MLTNVHHSPTASQSGGMLFFQCLYCAVWATVVLANVEEPDAQSSKGYTFGSPGKNASFDYVIVGGGTAGLTLATRLAANTSLNIAVIEAGGFYEADAGNVSVVPGYDAFFASTSPSDLNPLIDWGFVTTPQTVCR